VHRADAPVHRADAPVRSMADVPLTEVVGILFAGWMA
jgi:hypothetical protein